METQDCIYFFSSKKGVPFAFLSQCYPCSFSDTQYTYNSTEQYLMAQKAILFNDEYNLKCIMSSSSPYMIKKYGKMIQNFNEDVWRLHLENIILQGNLLKFEQNKDLKELLLNTGTKELAEANPYDDFLGIAREAKENLTKDKWQGKNILGNILMNVREILR